MRWWACVPGAEERWGERWPCPHLLHLLGFLFPWLGHLDDWAWCALRSFSVGLSSFHLAQQDGKMVRLGSRLQRGLRGVQGNLCTLKEIRWDRKEVGWGAGRSRLLPLPLPSCHTGSVAQCDRAGWPASTSAALPAWEGMKEPGPRRGWF